MALFGSVIELAHGMSVLQQAGSTCGIPSVFRTLLETRVEFVNLMRDATYGYHMEAADLRETLKVLKTARDKKNAFLPDLAAMPNLDQLIDDLVAQFDKLMKEGCGPLTVFDRFVLAGMEDEYRSIYNSLSSDAHSNRRALVDRHVEFNEGDFELVFFKSAPDEYALPYMESATTYVVESTREILLKFGTEAATVAFDAVLVQIPEFRTVNQDSRA